MSREGTRRDFLRSSLAAAGWVAAPFAGAALPGNRPEHADLRLGVASYSLRAFARTRAIEMIGELGVGYVNVKSFHLPYESSQQELAAGRAEFRRAGLTIVGGGTVSLKKDDDDDIRSYFEYAKTCGMPLMVIAPTKETLGRIERFVRQYDIKVAIHNHGPEDLHFPAPQDALEVIRTMDRRVGLCIDVGHTARTGTSVVEAVAEAGDRLLDMHMKDLRDLSSKTSQCVVGEGAMPVVEIFRQLQTISYGGMVNLEYEIDKDDPLPGMKQSLAYMRGVLAALRSAG